jgi:hypothetical protein
MELEVAEPSLFLELAEGSYDRFAHVIRSRLIGAAATAGRAS